MDEHTNEIAKGLNHGNFYLRPIDGRVVPDHVRISVERVNAGDIAQILDVDELVGHVPAEPFRGRVGRARCRLTRGALDGRRVSSHETRG